MIVCTWLAYLLAREGVGAPFPAASTQDIPVVEMETLSVLEHWLRKIEEKASRIFRQKLEGRSEREAEHPSAPLEEQDCGGTSSQDELVSTASSLGLSPSPSFMDDRTKIQFLRWRPGSEGRQAGTEGRRGSRSQTRVYRVSSSIRDEAMQERLGKIRQSVSQVMLEPMQDSVSDTDIRATLSSEG
ncbi:spermatogenesis-associated protein 19, mitochondrial [Dromaius novaehollandiae]|uniref:spermatogenesis-associated protein 19, mitochondrial n=1 Tax=Dromaius novaehollandiae TaxID=8790 RepID=UPI000E1EA76D|nr:spermatogenesis-associated protein 19, mitochondrial [Dromaius novaehollandiae]